MVVSYCRTGQDRDAKIMFRTLYHDIKAASDVRYIMEKIEEKDNRKDDTREFITKVSEIETSSIDLINCDELYKCLVELKQEEL